MKFKITLVISALLYLSGCGGIGPRTVSRDRFEYTDAISGSWKRQMLLNMVKIRYGDAPVFLDVTSVINQYLLETQVDGSLAWNAFLPEASQNVGARSRYADRPTISYQPLQGEKFTRSMMTPIPPHSILSLMEAGWRVDYLFRLCVQSVNGNYNRIGHQMTVKEADPDFYRLISGMRKVQKSAAVGMRLDKAKEGQPANVLFFRKKGVTPEIVEEQKMVRQILGLNMETEQFKVVYGALATDDTEIAILSRSMLQILSELASYIDIPKIHVEEKRAPGNFAVAADTKAEVMPLLRVHSALKAPEDDFVSIQYRGYWYWIDDTDYWSKRMLTFVMYLFTLAETGAPSQAPVLTIPAG
jgi:SH3-like domain-containing protein